MSYRMQAWWVGWFVGWLAGWLVAVRFDGLCCCWYLKAFTFFFVSFVHFNNKKTTTGHPCYTYAVLLWESIQFAADRERKFSVSSQNTLPPIKTQLAPFMIYDL